jgi:hypothetical protein
LKVNAPTPIGAGIRKSSDGVIIGGHSSMSSAGGAPKNSPIDQPKESADDGDADEQLEMDDYFDEEGIGAIRKPSFNGPKKIHLLFGIIPLRSTVSSPI